MRKNSWLLAAVCLFIISISFGCATTTRPVVNDPVAEGFGEAVEVDFVVSTSLDEIVDRLVMEGEARVTEEDLLEAEMSLEEDTEDTSVEVSPKAEPPGEILFGPYGAVWDDEHPYCSENSCLEYSEQEERAWTIWVEEGTLVDQYDPARHGTPEHYDFEVDVGYSHRGCPGQILYRCARLYRLPAFRELLNQLGWPTERMVFHVRAGYAGATIRRFPKPDQPASVYARQANGETEVINRSPGGEERVVSTIRDGTTGAAGEPGKNGFHSLSFAWYAMAGNQGFDTDDEIGEITWNTGPLIYLTFTIGDGSPKLRDRLRFELEAHGAYIGDVPEDEWLLLGPAAYFRIVAVRDRLDFRIGGGYDAISLNRHEYDGHPRHGNDTRYEVDANSYGGAVGMTVRLVGPLWLDLLGRVGWGTLNPTWMAGGGLRLQLFDDR